MKRTRPNFRQPWIGKCVLSLFITVGFVGTSFAQQFDAPYLALEKRNKDKWAAEDREINKKLVALERKFDKKPNIIYILADDVGWGEMGWQGGGKHRGTPTPELDKMAFEGMRFWTAYAEPSCTPSRIAINTGRHPVRTGLLSVLWPGQIEGLSPKEVTVAEVLSKAGYNTAMWGKWHLGDSPEQAPENQGYDYAYYGLWNGAPDNWPGSFDMYKDAPNPNKAMFYDFPGEEEYKKRTGIDLSVAGYIGRKGKRRKPIEGVAGKLGPERQDAFEAESIKQITAYVKDKAKDDKPFFIYIGRPTPSSCRDRRPTTTTSTWTRSTPKRPRWRRITHTCGSYSTP
jgi:arylsulfatase